MQTYLQLTNEVLARMREASVATVTETVYSTFIGKLLNQVKREIERAYYWNALRDTYSITTSDGVSSYGFTGAGPNAVVVDAWNTTTPGAIEKSTNADFNAKFFGTESVQTGDVTQYVPTGITADFDLKVDVWPVPEATAQTLKFNIYSPQNDLSDGSDVPLIPQEVLIEETVARAMVERGDESAPKPQPGETFILKDLLAQAVAAEAGDDDDETTWEPE